MKRLLMTGLAAACLIGIAGTAPAQTDAFGVPDTLYAELAKINDYNWSVTVSLTNDQSIVGLSLPFEMVGGRGVKVVADSAVYKGGRVEHFDYKGFRADTAIQCVTLGMIANLGPNKHDLAAGRGRLVTFFVSSANGEPIEQLKIDSTTTPPNNSLMMVANRVQPGNPPDTIPYGDRGKQEIVPVLVIREAQ